jgi:phosphoribosylanthranilate isomerase
MVKVKVCGLTRDVDIAYINELSPQYVGFVFAKSKRLVDVNKAADLIKKLNNGIETVGIFVDESLDNIKAAANFLKLDILQLHGEEAQEYIDELNNYRVWKAVGVRSEEDIVKASQYRCEAVLLDSKTSAGSGGTGQTFHWELAKELTGNRKLVLAGGLNSSNVEAAVKELRPFGVDVSSGVETDGYKDFYKIKEFIEKVRAL